MKEVKKRRKKERINERTNKRKKKRKNERKRERKKTKKTNSNCININRHSKFCQLSLFYFPTPLIIKVYSKFIIHTRRYGDVVSSNIFHEIIPYVIPFPNCEIPKQLWEVIPICSQAHLDLQQNKRGN